MIILEIITNDSENVPKTFGYKISNELLTLEDQEEALTKPEWAYYFARDIPGANIPEFVHICNVSMAVI